MALPQLNLTPSYDLTIPSTGQTVTYRPFLVKEQKNLLIALETQDRKGLLRSIVRTIHACVEQPIESKLTTFDVDYAFTKIRSKSVGETATILLPCDNCETKNEITVELDSVQLEGTVKESVINITDSIAVKMRYPSYDEFLDNQALLDSESLTESLFELMVVCMEAIHTEEERYSLKDESREDVVAFIESMTTDQYQKIADYVNQIPYIVKKVDFTCSSCGHVNEKELKGMDDFF